MLKKIGVILFTAGFLGAGCSPTVKVEAPDKPIVIDLNVNIEHHVKIQVDKQLDSLMSKEKEIF